MSQLEPTLLHSQVHALHVLLSTQVPVALSSSQLSVLRRSPPSPLEWWSLDTSRCPTLPSCVVSALPLEDKGKDKSRDQQQPTPPSHVSAAAQAISQLSELVEGMSTKLALLADASPKLILKDVAKASSGVGVGAVLSNDDNLRPPPPPPLPSPSLTVDCVRTSSSTFKELDSFAKDFVKATGQLVAMCGLFHGVVVVGGGEVEVEVEVEGGPTLDGSSSSSSVRGSSLLASYSPNPNGVCYELARSIITHVSSLLQTSSDLLIRLSLDLHSSLNLPSPLALLLLPPRPSSSSSSSSSSLLSAPVLVGVLHERLKSLRSRSQTPLSNGVHYRRRLLKALAGISTVVEDLELGGGRQQGGSKAGGGDKDEGEYCSGLEAWLSGVASLSAVNFPSPTVSVNRTDKDGVPTTARVPLPLLPDDEYYAAVSDQDFYDNLDEYDRAAREDADKDEGQQQHDDDVGRLIALFAESTAERVSHDNKYRYCKYVSITFCETDGRTVQLCAAFLRHFAAKVAATAYKTFDMKTTTTTTPTTTADGLSSALAVGLALASSSESESSAPTLRPTPTSAGQSLLGGLSTLVTRLECLSSSCVLAGALLYPETLDVGDDDEGLMKAVRDVCDNADEVFEQVDDLLLLGVGQTEDKEDWKKVKEDVLRLRRDKGVWIKALEEATIKSRERQEREC